MAHLFHFLTLKSQLKSPVIPRQIEKKHRNLPCSSFFYKIAKISAFLLFLFLPSHLVAQTSQSKRINALLNKDYKKEKLNPQPLIDDATFLRRAYLQIIGRIPTLTEAKTFLKDKTENKRHKLIDSLVDSEGFKSKMFLFYAELLRLKSVKEQHGAGFHQFIHRAAHENLAFDKMVYQMLSATGHVAENPAVGYYLRDTGMTLDNVANSVQVFLGTQIGCAQCHNHPFEKTTQMDFYQLAAFSGGFDFKMSSDLRQLTKKIAVFAAKEDGLDVEKLLEKYSKQKSNRKKHQLNRKINRKYGRKSRAFFRHYRRNSVQDIAAKKLKLPHDYQYDNAKPHAEIAPKTLFGKMPDLHNAKDRRETFARWMTSPENPMFTKVLANRLWHHAYGHGLVHPLDDWTTTTKPAHPRVLDFLSKELKKNNYNIRETLRHLYHAQLFQRTVYPREIQGGTRHTFTAPIMRRMRGEEIHDSFIQLEKGKLDDKKNTARIRAWNNYVKLYQSIKKMSAKDLYTLNQAIAASEKASLKVRKEARKFRIQAQQAKKQGKLETFKKLQQEARKKQRQSRQQAKISMNSMGIQSYKTADGTPAHQLIQFAMQRNLRFPNKKQLRASEKAQPFKPASLVREFGSTDGEVSNNSSEHSSITQTLALLNGNEIIQVTDRKGSLPRHLKQAKTPAERIDVLFLSLYSRYPTEEEKKAFSPYAKSRHTLVPLAKAMLNSKRFLFVQ